MYRTEAAFSKALIARLNKEHIRTTRIESPSTGVGIPDLYVDGRGVDTFLELKNDPKHSIFAKTIKVAWRPGQTAWMFEYFCKHTTKNCLTLVACCDGIIIIPMTYSFKDHIVYEPKGITYNDFRKIKLHRVLDAMQTYFFTQGAENYLDYINKFVDLFYPGIDYDPECLWNPNMLEDHIDIRVFNNYKLDMIMTLEATAINNKWK